MGYTTDFDGRFKLNRKLNKKDHKFLTKLAETRRVVRKVDAKYGVDGEFYVDGEGDFGQAHDSTILDYNKPPRTQPGLWCQWVPSEGGQFIQWDGGEKFYNYVEWLKYLIVKVLAPRNYILNGEVTWTGEDRGDVGKIIVVNNMVTTKQGRLSFED
jgi:hypothetical protein